jgi:GDPmannose 4,6-dehydratase
MMSAAPREASMSLNQVALITGVTGQDGSYLSEFLLGMGYEVHGLRRRNSSFNTHRIDHLINTNNKFYLHDGDMTDTSGLFALLNKVSPSEIYNLAAQSHVGASFDTPEYTANVDALGTLRILEALRQNPVLRLTKFYQASTSELFGNSPAPQNEASLFAPRSPYAVAKLYAHWITVNYRESYGLHASCGILFNHESSRRGPTFVSKKIIDGIIRHKSDSSYQVSLGNLNSKRDWGHAREYAEAMWRVLQLDSPVDLVLGTGNSMTVRDFASLACEHVGITITWTGDGFNEVGTTNTGQILFKVNKEYFRPSEVNFLEADARKARELIDWKPTIEIGDLIAEMFKDSEKESLQT